MENGQLPYMREERLVSSACLLRPSLPIRAESRADPSAEFPDVPLAPLPILSYPGVNWRPSLVRDPILLHPLTQGGLGDMGLEIRKKIFWLRRKVAMEGPEGGAARFA